MFKRPKDQRQICARVPALTRPHFCDVVGAMPLASPRCPCIPLGRPVTPAELFHNSDRSVIIAMGPVRMMQMTAHQVAHVITMRHGLVPTAGSMHMARSVSRALVIRCAPVWVRRRDLDLVLIHVIVVHVMQVTVMQIINVVVMLDGRVPATCPVYMRVVGMRMVVGTFHDINPLRHA